ncbi:hypothetical protein HY486_00615 [Candidatus Woesearchaeota archaeon]|nr:hypothetical protein [Candidatus Woesearchaeota archaeon]
MTYEPRSAMDRGYIPVADISPKDALEKPILSFNQIGQTVVETDQMTGRNILQNVQAAIRGGAGTIQLVMMTSRKQPLGGGAKAIGKDLQQALREVALANQVNITGLELPTGATNNLSGWDPQGRRIDKQAQNESIKEVHDAIQFAASLGGGEVDLVSFEFPRALYEQDWNKKSFGKKVVEVGGERKVKERKMFEIPDEDVHEELRFVDAETGSVSALSRRRLPNPFFDEKLRKLSEEGKSYESLSGEEKLIFDRERYISWDDYLKRFTNSNEFREKFPEGMDKADQIKVRAVAFEKIGQEIFKREISSANAQIARTQDFMENDETRRTQTKAEIEMLENKNRAVELFRQQEGMLRQAGMSEREIEFRRRQAERVQNMPETEAREALADAKQKDAVFAERIGSYANEIEEQRRAKAEYERRKKNLKYFEDFAREQSVDGYKQAGIIAWQESKIHAKDLKKPLEIGPEIGWPQYYGGHPQEFIDLIDKARHKMSAELQKSHGLSENDAEEAAKKHIKGIFDTGHLGMWLEYFRPELPWDERVKEFKKWYMEQVKKISDGDYVSGIQAVDSATGAHAHLPPGQGILPVVEAVKEFKKNGFDGFVVSEGHEEEKLGQGRILWKAWQAFDPKLKTASYLPSVAWSSVHNSYMGRLYSPRYMVSSTAPIFGEYRPWAGGDNPIPFE